MSTKLTQDHTPSPSKLPATSINISTDDPLQNHPNTKPPLLQNHQTHQPTITTPAIPSDTIDINEFPPLPCASKAASGDEANQKKPSPPLQTPTNPTIKPWAALFGENKKLENGSKLSLHDVVVGSKLVFDENEVVETQSAWGGYCLIAYVVGRFPGRQAVKDVKDSWGVESKYFLHHTGWLVFKFPRENDMLKVLNGGPYSCFGKPWVMRQMPKYFSFSEHYITAVPIWIQLPNLPLECWGVETLGRITSYAGTPISTDKATKERTHPSFARVLVEIDTNKPIVSKVDIVLPNGKEFEQPLIYEVEPIFCKKCGDLGHEASKCGQEQMRARSQARSRAQSRGRSTTRMVWRPKKREEGLVMVVQDLGVAETQEGAAENTREGTETFGGKGRSNEGAAENTAKVTENAGKSAGNVGRSNKDFRADEQASEETETFGRTSRAPDLLPKNTEGVFPAPLVTVEGDEVVEKGESLSLEDDDPLGDDDNEEIAQEQELVNKVGDKGKAKVDELPRRGTRVRTPKPRRS